jgi:hypothetical protein
MRAFSFDPNNDREFVHVDEIKEQLLHANEIQRARSRSANEINPLVLTDI